MPEPRVLSEEEYNTIRERVLKNAPDGLDEKGFTEWSERMGRQQLIREVTMAEYGANGPEGSALGRFVGGAAKMLDPRPLLQGAVDVVFPTPAGVMRNAAIGESIIGGSVDQARKAGQAFKEGRYVEAAGHAAGTVPLIGTPAAQAGEQIGSGDVAGGLGAASALVGAAVAPSVVRGGKRLLASRAPALEQGAVETMNKALGATTKENKVRSARVAPEMAKRGVTARNLPALEEKAVVASEAAGQNVGRAVAEVADKTTDVLPIVEQLETSKAEFMGRTVDGRSVVNDPGPVAAVQKLQDVLMNYGDRISLGSLNKLRQNWDVIVQRGKGFTTEDVQTNAWAAREGRTALREVLSQEAPNIDQVMAEYAFWQNIEDIAHATNMRRVGQKGTLTPTIAGAGGAIVGELVAPGSSAISKIGMAAIGAKTAAGLRRLFDSPGYQMWSAVQKQRLADALASGNQASIDSAMATGLKAIGAEAAVTTTGDSQRRSRPLGVLTPAQVTP